MVAKGCRDMVADPKPGSRTGFRSGSRRTPGATPAASFCTGGRAHEGHRRRRRPSARIEPRSQERTPSAPLLGRRLLPCTRFLKPGSPQPDARRRFLHLGRHVDRCHGACSRRPRGYTRGRSAGWRARPTSRRTAACCLGATAEQIDGEPHAHEGGQECESDQCLLAEKPERQTYDRCE